MAAWIDTEASRLGSSRACSEEDRTDSKLAAMTDKQKRFRVHVVKEIFDTEREYTRSLEFTVTVSYLCVSF